MLYHVTVHCILPTAVGAASRNLYKNIQFTLFYIVLHPEVFVDYIFTLQILMSSLQFPYFPYFPFCPHVLNLCCFFVFFVSSFAFITSGLVRHFLSYFGPSYCSLTLQNPYLKSKDGHTIFFISPQVRKFLGSFRNAQIRKFLRCPSPQIINCAMKI
jgi:hypothetical protein